MEKKTTVNTCAGAGCAAGCLHVTHVENGRIIKIEAMTYPDGEKSTICLKAHAGARWPVHPDRLKYPLKRAGNRGEGNWERITWEQALDEIADKIKNIREEYGPASVCIQPLCNSYSPIGAIQGMLLATRLVNLLQATEFTGGGIDSNPYFADQLLQGMSFARYAAPSVLVEGKTKYMINWGGNPAETSLRWWKFIRQAQQEGAKLVDIGLIYDRTAKAADWWIPVQAGSDGALALAMIHVIIRDRFYDEAYVAGYTNGPFLVRSDDGRLLREIDISSGGSPENYVVWDEATGSAQVVAPHSIGPSGIRPALLGTYEPAGIDCKPAFQMLADLAREYTSERVEGITGVTAEAIERLTREYCETKPAAILIREGLRYMNSGNAYRAIYTLAALTGDIGTLGGGPICGGASAGGGETPFIQFNDLPLVMPAESMSRSIPLAQLFECITSGKPYPIRALVTYASNYLHTMPNPRRWIEEIFPNLELIVVNDIFMTATAEYADYVLPDCTLYEREDMTIGYGGHIVYLDKAIEPMYECRPLIYFWSELAKRLGLGEYFDKTIDEWIEMRLNSYHPAITGIEPPLTLERLKKEKTVRANVSTEANQPFLDKKFPTTSGRLHLYNEELVSTGDALPVFREQLDSPRSAKADKYPLVFNTANNRFFVHTAFANDALILEEYKKEPHLSINPSDAGQRGISDGDVVVVYNDRGSCKVKAMISETVPQGVVHIPHGWWPGQFIEGHLQNLIPDIAGPETRDESREIMWSLSQGKYSTFGFPEFLFTYSLDALSDCLCEVKRVDGDD